MTVDTIAPISRCALVAVRILAVGLLSLGFVMPVAAASQPSPVTIETAIDFSSFPFSGTFTVTEGAGSLGCSAGTFEDIPRGSGLGQIEKHFTCTSGAGAGDEFVVLFKNDCTFLSPAVFRCRPGPGDLGGGQWMVLSGTGDFAHLHGSGDFSVVFTGEFTGEETLSGRIHFE
jgi:hypothetical protein